MKLPEAAKLAVKNNDAFMAGRVAEQLRFSCGYNALKTQQWFERETGIKAEQFEELMYEADAIEVWGE